MIKHTPLQAAVSEYVAATDYSFPIPKIGRLNAQQLIEFNIFFTNMSDLFGNTIYYIGIEDRQHTFTDGLGWRQYLLFNKELTNSKANDHRLRTRNRTAG